MFSSIWASSRRAGISAFRSLPSKCSFPLPPASLLHSIRQLTRAFFFSQSCHHLQIESLPLRRLGRGLAAPDGGSLAPPRRRRRRTDPRELHHGLASSSLSSFSLPLSLGPAISSSFSASSLSPAYLIADDLPLQTIAAESDILRRLEDILEESSGDGTFKLSQEEMDMALGEEDLDGKARMREVGPALPKQLAFVDTS